MNTKTKEQIARDIASCMLAGKTIPAELSRDLITREFYEQKAKQIQDKGYEDYEEKKSPV